MIERPEPYIQYYPTTLYDEIMSRPKVSVIVPIYRVEKYIERCVRSLFEQTLNEIEYLFIDDCTPDDSISILLHVLEEYPHRKGQAILHRMEQNRGQAAVRKWGMLNCNGEYIIHCDSDDYVEKDMYRRMYECAKRTNSDMVRCYYDKIYGNRVVRCIDMPEQDYSDKMKLLTHLSKDHDLSSMCDKLVRHSLISYDLLFPTLNMMEDFVLTIQLLLRAKKISCIKDCLYHYSQNAESIVHKNDFYSRKSNHLDMVENIKTAIRILDSNKLAAGLSDEITAMKYIAKKNMTPFVGDKRCLKIWLDTFPEIDTKIFWCKCIPIKEKVKSLCVLTRIYPFIIRFAIAFYRIKNNLTSKKTMKGL